MSPDPWTNAMLRGDFRAAWEVSDRVLQRRLHSSEACASWPRHEQFIWRGQPVDGKRLLVRCYHGLGDTLQFVRLLKLLRPKVPEIILWAQPALLPLLRSLDGVDRLLPLHEGAPDVDYDVDVEVMELPHMLRLDVQSIPAEIPYLAPPMTRSIRADDSEIRRVGLCWSAGEWNPARSIPPAAFEPLRKLTHVRWFNLQYPLAPCPLAATPMAESDIAAMAAHMLTLDLVITVDTMVAHLAGALGLPVWLLLHHDPDWRWMRHRRDSPWYPTMTLFRQRRAGDWSDVIAAVGSQLAQDCAAQSSAWYSFKRL